MRMAPSRALLFRFSSILVTQCLHPHPRQLWILGTPSRPIHAISSSHHDCWRRPSLAICKRSYLHTARSVPDPPAHLNEAELHVFNKVKAQLEPVRLEVKDISGGCGSMYAIEIESPKFKGLTVIKQHKLVNEVLKEEIKGWHGIQLRTKVA